MDANTGQTIPWDRYARPSPSRKLVLRLNSLLLIPATSGELVECLKATGRKLPEGKSWSFVALSPILDELVKQGLLTGSFDCPLALLHAVAADAAASEDIGLLVAAICRVLPARRSSAIYYSASLGIDIKAPCRLLRVAVYENDEAEVIANRDLRDRTFGADHALTFLITIFLDASSCAAWLASRALHVQPLQQEAGPLGFLAQGAKVVARSAKTPDEWTDALPVAMKRPQKQVPRPDYLTSQDRRVSRTRQKNPSTSWYRQQTFEFDCHRAIAALVAHPTVFDPRQHSQPHALRPTDAIARLITGPQ